MITVGMNYEVLEGKEEIFENAFKKVLHAMEGKPGHEESHLYTEVGLPRQYMIVSQWSDRASFDAFIASDAFKQVTNWGKEQVLASRPKHAVYG